MTKFSWIRERLWFSAVGLVCQALAIGAEFASAAVVSPPKLTGECQATAECQSSQATCMASSFIERYEGHGQPPHSITVTARCAGVQNRWLACTQHGLEDPSGRAFTRASYVCCDATGAALSTPEQSVAEKACASF